MKKLVNFSLTALCVATLAACSGGGVRQVDDAAGEHQRALHQIARRAGNRGHNRLFLAQQRVE